MAGVKGRSGRKPGKLGLEWRKACREIAMLPEVIERVREMAKTDARFALQVAEQGFGRPFQAVHVKGHVTHADAPATIELNDGTGLPATSAPTVPGPNPNQPC